MTDVPDRRDLRDFATRWLAAWNSHDTAQVLALLHPNLRWEDTVFWPHPITDRVEMTRYIDRIWQVMPDVSFEEVQLFTAPDDGRALVLFRQQGSGPPQLAPGTRFDTLGCDIFLEFTDGLLSHYLAQYEITDMMRQLGALPPRDGEVGGAYLLKLLRAAPSSTEPGTTATR